jgi:hypothetical protein
MSDRNGPMGYIAAILIIVAAAALNSVKIFGKTIKIKSIDDIRPGLSLIMKELYCKNWLLITNYSSGMEWLDLALEVKKNSRLEIQAVDIVPEMIDIKAMGYKPRPRNIIEALDFLIRDSSMAVKKYRFYLYLCQKNIWIFQ